MATAKQMLDIQVKVALSHNLSLQAIEAQIGVKIDKVDEVTAQRILKEQLLKRGAPGNNKTFEAFIAEPPEGETEDSLTKLYDQIMKSK